MIKNKETFEKTVEESAETRVDIDVNLRSQYKGLMKTFEAGFLNEPKVFKRIVDILYYTGGYPTENTPPKFEQLVDDFAQVVTFLKLLENPKVEDRLQEVWGITLNMPDKKFTLEVESFDEAWKKYVAVDEPAPDNAPLAMKELTNRAMAIQGEICQKSDSIKRDNATKIEEECSIKKPTFMSCVMVKAKAKKKCDPVLVKVEREKLIDKHDDAIEVLQELQ